MQGHMRGPLSTSGSSAGLLLLIAGISCLCGCQNQPGESPSVESTGPPNILLVILDCVRADHVGAYGYGEGTTPHLDALAANGRLFERAYAPATWTIPSHVSMFTGRKTDLAGMPEDAGTAIAPWTPTLAGLLGVRGYRTGFFGNAPMMWEWPTLARGFSYTMATDAVNPLDHMGSDLPQIPERGSGGHARGDRPRDRREPRGGAPDAWQPFPPSQSPGEPTEEAGYVYSEFAYTRPAFLEWLDAAPADDPFFAFVHANDAHFPYSCGEVLRDGRTLSQHRKLMTKIDAITAPNANERGMGRPRELSGDELEHVLWSYDECVRQADEGLGVLVEKLRSRDQLDNTLLIIAADHGESLGVDGSYGHGTTHGNVTLGEDLIRVPLVVHYPAGKVTGRHTEPVSLVELFPTILESAGIEPTPNDGRSLWHAGDGEEKPRQLVVRGSRATKHRTTQQSGRMDHFAVVQGDRSVQVIFGETTTHRLVRPFGQEVIEDLAQTQQLLDGIFIPAVPAPPRPSQHKAPGDRWNLVIVDLPGLRRDALLAQDSMRGDMPALTRMLRDSVRFERAVAASHWTLPSLATLLTGRQPFSHGVLDREATLGPDVWTLAEVLAANGYRTAAFTGGLDTRAAFGLDQGFERYDDASTEELRTLGEAVPLAGSWLDGVDGEPFFVLLSGYDLHAPWHPAAAQAGPADGAIAKRTIDCGTLDAQWLTSWRDPGDGSSAQLPDGRQIEPAVLVDSVAACYRACLLDVDQALGDLFATLEERGRLRNTVIVLMGDHGESLGERGHMTRYHAAEVHSEVSRIPLLIRVPRKRAAGSHVDRWIGTADVMPTLLDLLTVAGPEAMDGVSLAGEFILDAGPAPAQDDGAVLSQAHDSMAFLSDDGLLVVPLAGPPQLFPLYDDDLPSEGEAIVDPAARHAAMAHFARYAQARSLAVASVAPRRSQVDQEFVELLRRYGYWDAEDEEAPAAP